MLSCHRPLTLKKQTVSNFWPKCKAISYPNKPLVDLEPARRLITWIDKKHMIAYVTSRLRLPGVTSIDDRDAGGVCRCRVLLDAMSLLTPTLLLVDCL